MRDLMSRAGARARRDFIDMRRRLYRRLSPAMMTKAAEVGQAYHVPAAIHPDDFMFWAMHDDINRQDKLGAVQAYFATGHESALALHDLLAAHAPAGPFDLMDFASGYGRVARHFRHTWPQARVVLSDIHQAAVRFAERLGLAAVPSTWVPEEFRPQPVDLIVSISFFTHMPREVWGRWLAALAAALKPGGHLLFTTHGEAAMPHMGVRDLDGGFLFFRASEQKDLELERYGSTVTLPEFVRDAVAQAGLQLVEFRAAGLGVQDVWIVRR